MYKKNFSWFAFTYSVENCRFLTVFLLTKNPQDFPFLYKNKTKGVIDNGKYYLFIIRGNFQLHCRDLQCFMPNFQQRDYNLSNLETSEIPFFGFVSNLYSPITNTNPSIPHANIMV